MPDDPSSQPIAPSSLGELPRGTIAQQPPPDTHPHPCERAYANLRVHVFDALTRIRPKWLASVARVVLLILDAPVRWVMHFADAVISNKGYVPVGSVLAVYFFVFGLIDAKSTQEETRASVERSVFMTLVSSGNAPSFVAAMKDFGPIQTMRVTEHPSWFKFWDWGRTYQPNHVPMWHWANTRLGLCKKELKDCSLRDDTRLDLSGADLGGADLRGAHLDGADLTNAVLDRWTQLDGAYLSDADLHDTPLNGAHLKSADLTGAHLNGAFLLDAVLTGADLTGAHLDGQRQLDQACGTDAMLPPGLTLKPCRLPRSGDFSGGPKGWSAQRPARSWSRRPSAESPPS